MLDELLGRAELKARIDELTEEKRHLQRRLDAENDRRADAVSARQEAEERVNRLEDRIAELDGRIERLDGDERSLDFRGSERLRGSRLDAILDRLRSVRTGPEGALTAMVETDVPDPVSDAFGNHAALVTRAAPCLVCIDDAGLVSAALTPPIAPDEFCEWDDGFRVDESWFRPTGEFGFALVRSDLFAYTEYDAECDDEEVSPHTAFETDVMNKHSKGGFSQARFERRRNQQIAAHVEKCREAIEERNPKRLILVGERSALHELRDLADHTATVDAGGDPEEALDDAFREFWTTKLYRI